MVWFSREDYELTSNSPHDNITENENIIGLNIWNQYLCAIKKIILNQYSLNLTTIHEE